MRIRSGSGFGSCDSRKCNDLCCTMNRAVNAWVSGGFLPASAVGTKVDGFIHIADWFAVFCHLAGVSAEDPSAAAAGLPAVDSLNVWELLIGQNKTSPRTRGHISPFTLIEGHYKLIAGPPAIFGSCFFCSFSLWHVRVCMPLLCMLRSV